MENKVKDYAGSFGMEDSSTKNFGTDDFEANADAAAEEGLVNNSEDENQNAPIVPKEEKKKEAIYRMHKLGINDAAIRDFANRNVVPFFVSGLGNGSFLFRYVHPLINDFETMFNVLVYAIVCAQTNYGFLESLLYISDEKEEWEMDRADIEDGYVVTWTENLDHPECSEFGSIFVRTTDDGLLYRVG